MSEPSTDWRERIAADEAERHAEAARRMVAIQRQRNATYGTGRALHRKQTAAFRGFLSVHGAVPDFARHGLFAHGGVYETWVRLSNGGMDRTSDARPDVRGLAIKVRGVQGASALGESETQSQDFLLINHRAFAFPTSVEFVELVGAAAEGNLAVVRHMLRRHGLVGGLRQLKRMKDNFTAPFAGYANDALHSAAPIACGPYAVRVRLTPDAGNGKPDPRAASGWGDDLARRLARKPLRWTLELQPFTRESETPIEDASVDWPTPYAAVATLELPAQSIDAAFLQEAESASFDPWQALAAHRPLGEVMRARKVTYFASQRERAAV